MKTTWTYKPNQKTPLRLSRSRIDLFIECRRCFWLLLRHNLKRPRMPEFLLNQAVDTLLKKEFDVYRKQRQPHPCMKSVKPGMIPYAHADLDAWRDPFEGVQTFVKEVNLLITGGVDDVWQTVKDDQLVVVDYKATAKDQPVTELRPLGSWHDGYRRQLEIYQWLLTKNDFAVHPTAYILYATGDPAAAQFDQQLKFSLNLIAHTGSFAWVDQTLLDIKACLDGDLPAAGTQQSDGSFTCAYCDYSYRRRFQTVPVKASK